MFKSMTTIFLLCLAALGLVLSGCSSNGSGGVVSSPGATNSTVSGIASLDTASGTVSLKDSAVPAQEKITPITGNGSYAVDVTGLKAPFILKAEGIDQTGNNLTLYSISNKGGRTNINPLSDIAVAASADANAIDASALYSMRSSEDDYHRTTDSFEGLIYKLRTVLAPLYELYNISGNGVDDDHESDDSGLRAMLHDVRFVVSSRIVTVTNRQTGSIIFKGSLSDLSSGTFYQENMPGGIGSNACSYTYSAWGACQSNNTQTRTVLTSSPSGCTGTPVLSQACVYTLPVTACTSFTYSSWSACDSTGNQTRTVLTSSPSGCAGGSPVLTQACTYVPPTCTYNYSTWGACQSNNTQTRTVTSSSPAGCTGTPVLSQACTYVPPVTTCTSFTYSAWGACQSNNTQTRTVATSSPSGCTGGTPVLSQACTYVPPAPTLTLAQVTASCTMCHGLTVNTTVLAPGGYTVTGRTASSWLSTVNTMVGYGAPLASGFTAQDYANFLAALP